LISDGGGVLDTGAVRLMFWTGVSGGASSCQIAALLAA